HHRDLHSFPNDALPIFAPEIVKHPVDLISQVTKRVALGQRAFFASSPWNNCHKTPFSDFKLPLSRIYVVNNEFTRLFSTETNAFRLICLAFRALPFSGIPTRSNFISFSPAPIRHGQVSRRYARRL